LNFWRPPGVRTGWSALVPKGTDKSSSEKYLKNITKNQDEKKMLKHKNKKIHGLKRNTTSKQKKKTIKTEKLSYVRSISREKTKR